MRFNNDKRVQHSHITLEHLKAVSGYGDDLPGQELEVVIELEDKLEVCPVCRARYRFFMHSEKTLQVLRELGRAEIVSLGQLLADHLNWLDERLRAEVSRWLEGAQDLLQSLDGAALTTVQAGATRGMMTEGEGRSIVTVDQEDGSFSFVMDEPAELVFRVPSRLDQGTPVCLVISGLDDGFFGVYPLTGLELPGLSSVTLESPVVRLETGEYELTVPVMEVDEG